MGQHPRILGQHEQNLQCYNKEVEQQVVLLNNEGLGIRSIGRVLQIPKSSVQLLLLKASQQIQPPVYDESGQVYEVDELYAPVGGKLCFVIYAINRATRKVIDYVTGARTKDNIGKVIRKLLSLAPKKIYTDKLPLFSYIIPGKLHRIFQYKTNRIERKNLTLRTHLKRLSRKTICYSKSQTMLEACFRLYVWEDIKPAHRLNTSPLGYWPGKSQAYKAEEVTGSIAQQKIYEGRF